jgi:hypothetical protein
MQRPTVVPHCVWEAADGRRASTAGALPWRSPAERDRDGWRAVDAGFTVLWADGTTGGMPGSPWRTREEAEAAIVSRDPFTGEELHAALKRLEAAGIDAKWGFQRTFDGGCIPMIVFGRDCIITPLELERFLGRRETANA